MVGRRTSSKGTAGAGKINIRVTLNLHISSCSQRCTSNGRGPISYVRMQQHYLPFSNISVDVLDGIERRQ
jgi:hypothetical protein